MPSEKPMLERLRARLVNLVILRKIIDALTRKYKSDIIKS